MSDDTSWGVEPRHAQHHAQVSADVPVTPDAPAALLSDAELAAVRGRAQQSRDERARSFKPLVPNQSQYDREILLAHIDALTSERAQARVERGGWRDTAAIHQGMLKRSREQVEEVEAERDALQARLDAAEAGIAAERTQANANYVSEWPSDLAARGRAKGRMEGLEIAARIVGAS